MSSSFDTPADIGSELTEINRRLRVLESAARVPQITTSGEAAIQGGYQDNGSAVGLNGTGAEEDNLGAPSLYVQPTPARTILLMYGGYVAISSGTGTAYLTIDITAPDGSDLPDDMPIMGWGFESLYTETSGWAMRTVTGWSGAMLPRVKLQMSYGKQAGSFHAGFSNMWMVAIPL